MRQHLLALALAFAVTGCSHAASPLTASVASAARATALASSAAQTAFLNGDHTFQASGTGNAFKVEAGQVEANSWEVQMWYRDMDNYFGNVGSIDAVYTKGHEAQHFTLTLLRPGFYQMNSPAPSTFGTGASVAFDANHKWDSNMGANYEIHFQVFPPNPQPW